MNKWHAWRPRACGVLGFKLCDFLRTSFFWSWDLRDGQNLVWLLVGWTAGINIWSLGWVNSLTYCLVGSIWTSWSQVSKPLSLQVGFILWVFYNLWAWESMFSLTIGEDALMIFGTTNFKAVCIMQSIELMVEI